MSRPGCAHNPGAYAVSTTDRAAPVRGPFLLCPILVLVTSYFTSVAEFADTLRDVLNLYRESLTMPNVGAVDPSRDIISQGSGGHGTHGDRGRIQSFGSEAPFSERFAAWLEKAVAVWRYEMDRERQGVEKAELPAELVELAKGLQGIASTRDGEAARKGGRPNASKRAEDRAILAMKGDPIVVGLLFDRSADNVRRLRERHNQDPHTGDRAPAPRPLTSRELPEAA